MEQESLNLQSSFEAGEITHGGPKNFTTKGEYERKIKDLGTLLLVDASGKLDVDARNVN